MLSFNTAIPRVTRQRSARIWMSHKATGDEFCHVESCGIRIESKKRSFSECAAGRNFLVFGEPPRAGPVTETFLAVIIRGKSNYI